MLQTTTRIPQAETASDGHGGAYRTALAHSRRVRKLRILLPVSAALISALFIGVSFVRAYLPEGLSVQSARIEDGKIVMESPAIAGRNEKGTSYSLTAARALQDLTNPNMITLENVKASMPLNEEVIARVNAAGGLFDRSADKLNMDQPFQVDLSNGIKAKFRSAQIDVPHSLMETQDPVEVTTNDASIVANSMKILDNGKTLLFAGQVQVVLERSATPSGTQSSTP